MRVLKNAWFHRFVRKEGISDASLCEAVARAAEGLIDADLGGGLVKQRIARSGAGRSGGYRTLIFFRSGVRAIVAFGFAKSDRDNIDRHDEANLKKAAKIALGFSESEIDRLLLSGALVEVKCHGQEGLEQNLSKRSGRGRP